MTKTCMRRSSRSSRFRVSFSKVVDVQGGAPPKPLKRVNATNLAYDVLRTKGRVNPTAMRRLVKKHTQHGGVKRAMRQTVRTLQRLHDRLRFPRGDVTAVGACVVRHNNVHSHTKWTDKIGNAHQLLEQALHEHQQKNQRKHQPEHKL